MIGTWIHKSDKDGDTRPSLDPNRTVLLCSWEAPGSSCARRRSYLCCALGCEGVESPGQRLKPELDQLVWFNILQPFYGAPRLVVHGPSWQVATGGAPGMCVPHNYVGLSQRLSPNISNWNFGSLRMSPAIMSRSARWVIETQSCSGLPVAFPAGDQAL